MKARAKSSNTPYPLWIHGEYVTNPPIRPSDGAERPEGHYIDRGGYPGANVYAINFDTFCRQTAAVDKKRKGVCVVAYANTFHCLIAIITPTQIIL